MSSEEEDSVLEESLWRHICDVTPNPEIVEISKIIGTKIILENKNLWIELKALKNIMSEMAMLEFADSEDSATISSSFVPHLNLHSKPLHVPSSRPSTSDSQISRRSLDSDPIEFISKMRHNICIERIHLVVHEIREFFEREQIELEHEINAVRNAMEGDVETICSKQSPRINRNLSEACPHCNSEIETKQYPGRSTATEKLCLDCKSKHRRGKKLADKLPKKQIQDAGLKSTSLIDEMAVGGGAALLNVTVAVDSRSGCEGGQSKSLGKDQERLGGRELAKSSKFRNRIQSARDEHHFFDEFL